MVTALRDLNSKNRRRRSDVIKWVPSGDFIYVCLKANIPPEDMRKTFAMLVSTKPALCQYHSTRLETVILNAPEIK